MLPFCRELRELSLISVDIPPLVQDVDLPLVRTLQKLSLTQSTLAWMDGLVFTQLQRFDVYNPGSPETFKQNVGMPACTHVVFEQYEREGLPILQSNFHLPLLDAFELPSLWLRDEERVISALQWIHAKKFKFGIFDTPPRFLEFLESKDEVEQLDLVIFSYSAETAQDILNSMSATNHITMKVPCPNMKVLGLQFHDIRGAKNREQVSQSCRQMMNERRSAGHFLEKCYIWWHHEDRKKAAAFVLVMENEVVTESS